MRAQVKLLTPICDNDVPKLKYEVVAVGSPNKTVTITWVNPDGADVVQSGLPLSGTVLWPGAKQDRERQRHRLARLAPRERRLGRG